MIVARCIVIF